MPRISSPVSPTTPTIKIRNFLGEKKVHLQNLIDVGVCLYVDGHMVRQDAHKKLKILLVASISCLIQYLILLGSTCFNDLKTKFLSLELSFFSRLTLQSNLNCR
ncbi:hypothetical protein E2542_SST30316 [Spatholobus suberectus]|nr:hypothetical protein E2542_SST30316 [Spatholobus suberectus]